MPGERISLPMCHVLFNEEFTVTVVLMYPEQVFAPSKVSLTFPALTFYAFYCADFASQTAKTLW